MHGNGGDQRLHGYDGETGAVVYDGGGPNELMAGTHSIAPLALQLADASMSPGTIKFMPLPCREDAYTHADVPTSRHYHADANSDTDYRLRHRPRDLLRHLDPVQVRTSPNTVAANARIE